MVVFLEGEKKAIIQKRRQCEKFLLVEIEDDVREFFYKLRKKANEELSLVLRLLSLIRYEILIQQSYFCSVKHVKI